MGTQINHNPEGKNLALHFNVLTNVFDGEDQFKAELILTNQSAQPLKKNWSIYFNFLRMILPDSVSNGFQISHINGDYFCLEPKENFSSLKPNSKVSIEFIASFWAIKKIDAPVGFYIVYRDEAGNESTPQSLPSLSIGDFNRPEQVVRTTNDHRPVPTAESRFVRAKEVNLLPVASLIPIIPTPVFVQKREGTFNIKPYSQINYQADLKNEAQFLASFLGKYFDKPLKTVEGIEGDIMLSMARVRVDKNLEELNSESYTLSIDSSGVDLVGAGRTAVFYAIQSLLQLLHLTEKKANSELAVPYILVRDKPQFTYRGIHLDVSRNFHGVETIKKLMDLLSFYKLNKFHFHLTDDEGWRIEIAGLPELTEVGGRRGHTYTEEECLFPSYGSGHDPNDLNSAGNGFYSREEFIDLLHYANERHIEVIPAIDFPGHARAAVHAMEVRYNKYKELGDMEKANEYLLTDWDDTSEYESVQMWRGNVVNIGLPSTYRFIEKITDELIAVYSEAGLNLSTIHVGGDEVPSGAWLKSPVCLNLMQNHSELRNIHDLMEYFIEQLNEILTSKGIQTAGWEEIVLTHKNGKVEPNTTMLKHNLQPYTWNTIWGEGGEEMPYRLANLGYQLVLSNAPSLYFDLAYDKDPDEAGYYWAGYTNTEDTFKFLPLDFFKSAEMEALGKLIDSSAHYQNAERLSQKGRKNILGIQGQLWGETIRSADRLEYLLLPRLCALAERAWSAIPDWSTVDDINERKNAYRADWNQFANLLGRIELPRLDYLFDGVHYRVPMPGAILENGSLIANTPFPGLTIRYTMDGTEPNMNSSVYKGPIQTDSRHIQLKTFTSNGRSSRTTIVNR